MRFSRWSIATLTALTITTMLLLSILMLYLGVLLYTGYEDRNLLESLPPGGAQAYREISAGVVPNTENMTALVHGLQKLGGSADTKLYMFILVFGLGCALFCSFVGILLTRRITRPIAELTAATEGLTGGDFSLRVPSQTSSKEVISLVQTFNELAASLEMMEDRLQFNNMAIAHELRTPLTILKGSIQGIQDGVFHSDSAMLSSLLEQVDGLARLVEDLRTLSLAAGQKLLADREIRDVGVEVKSVFEAARPLIEAHEMAIEWESSPAFALIDQQRIRQAVLALLENACIYAGPGKLIRWETGMASDREISIRIIDHGPGFPDAVLPGAAMDLFWRGETSRSRSSGGTGLGLSIVKAIAIAHGGRLEIGRSLAGGAVVSLTLPAATALTRT
jgi:two-component system sensor histidine kinase AdeS